MCSRTVLGCDFGLRFVNRLGQARGRVRRRVVVPEIDAELIRVFQIPLAAMAERALQEFGEGQLQLLLFAFQLLILLMQSLDR